MRNEIYARKGRTFSTPKLHKYFSRKDWYKPRKGFQLKDLSQVEICNAHYLAGRHPERNTKSWGRAIHVGIEDDAKNYTILQDSIHACLSDRTQDRGMHLFSKTGIGYPEYFKDYVDLIVAVQLGKKSEIRMTLLDPKHVSPEEQNRYMDAQPTMRSGLFQFANELQRLLEEYDITERIGETKGSYLGVTIILSNTNWA